MPQRQFWSQRHEMRLSAVFSLDPTLPGAPPWFQVSTYDQEGALVRQGTYRVPPTMAEAAACDLYHVAMETWMASSVDEALIAVRRRVTEWWSHADQQAATA